MLSSQNRGEFYAYALAGLEQLGSAEPGGPLLIDMSGTERIDSSGLATLVLLQVRAAERKHTVGLRGLTEEMRFLLLMTRLEDRFDLDPAP